MKVYTDILTGTEFYSDAKVIHDDGNGMLWIESVLATEGGGAIDVGGGNEFGGAEEDEGCDDKAETKLDHFWQFGDIENEVSFSSFSKFKKDYYQYYVAMCRQLAKDGKVPAEHKETLKDNLKSALAFIEANFSSIQFYSVSPYLEEHPEYADAEGTAPLFGTNMAYLIHGEDGAKFYFVKGAFNEIKF